jgi:hypothetical protein
VGLGFLQKEKYGCPESSKNNGLKFGTMLEK